MPREQQFVQVIVQSLVSLVYVYLCPNFAFALQVLWSEAILFAAIFVSVNEYRNAVVALEEKNMALIASSSAKSAFLSTIGHEVRTPLNAIIGSAEMLLHQKLSTSEERSLQELTLKAGTSLLGTINCILDYVRMESKQTSLEQNCMFSIREMMQDVVQSNYERARTKNIQLKETWNISTDLVQGFPVSLKCVFTHLLSNAVKFTEQGHVHLMVEQCEDCILVTVQDTGIGIPDEFLSRMFLPFSQADARIKQQYGGTGIGLAISHSLVQFMKGTISCKTVVGKGTTFSVNIPVQWCQNEQSTASRLQETGKIATSKTWRVLIVDDNELNAKVMAKMMENHGAITYRASSGQQALQLLQQVDVDLVFTVLQKKISNYFSNRHHLGKTHFPITSTTQNLFGNWRRATPAAPRIILWYFPKTTAHVSRVFHFLVASRVNQKMCTQVKSCVFLALCSLCLLGTLALLAFTWVPFSQECQEQAPHRPYKINSLSTNKIYMCGFASENFIARLIMTAVVALAWIIMMIGICIQNNCVQITNTVFLMVCCAGSIIVAALDWKSVVAATVWCYQGLNGLSNKPKEYSCDMAVFYVAPVADSIIAICLLVFVVVYYLATCCCCKTKESKEEGQRLISASAREKQSSVTTSSSI